MNWNLRDCWSAPKVINDYENSVGGKVYFPNIWKTFEVARESWERNVRESQQNMKSIQFLNDKTLKTVPLGIEFRSRENMISLISGKVHNFSELLYPPYLSTEDIRNNNTKILL